jgi:hypothetical protein
MQAESSQNHAALTGLRPRKFGRVEARAEQSLGSADALEGSHDVQRERDEPIVVDVGQLALGLRPDKLIRIELRRVARKAVYIQAGMSLEKDPHVPTPMNLPAIPEQDEGSPQMAEQLPEERDDFGTCDVAHVEIKVQPEAVATRGHGQGRDDGDLLTPITMPKVRSVPDGRPGLAHVGNQEKPAFVEECEMGAAARGVFLTAAIHSASTGQWPPHRAGAHGARAFANSIRGCAGATPICRPRCSGHRTVFERLHQCVGASTAQWGSRRRRRREAAAPSTAPVVSPTGGMGAPASVEDAARSVYPGDMPVATGRLN